MSERTMTVQQLYDYVVSQIPPEEALKRLLGSVINQYKHMRGLEGQHGYPEAIMACAALEMGWNIAIESDKENDQIQGIAFGTKEYIEKHFTKKDK